MAHRVDDKAAHLAAVQVDVEREAAALPGGRGEAGAVQPRLGAVAASVLLPLVLVAGGVGLEVEVVAGGQPGGVVTVGSGLGAGRGAGPPEMIFHHQSAV